MGSSEPDRHQARRISAGLFFSWRPRPSAASPFPAAWRARRNRRISAPCRPHPEGV